MITFYGKVSPACADKVRSYRMKEIANAYFISAPICAAIAFLLFLAFGFRYPLLTGIAFVMAGHSVNFVFVGSKHQKMAKQSVFTYDNIDTTSIVFEESWVNYEEIETELTEIIHLSDIRKVIDMGECYLLYAKNQRVQQIICQKSLLEEGEPDEFEDLFADKLKKLA